ncbi:hypothetical protein NPIL_131421 [Nephila pilipes]|uniref:Uncharacterized protein n=1 Tax=Nephila pilipes TaxID=299642 RepID=A0A8X6QBU2_NEPPI|nr:hypothetical protein NPIL_131421 [Nephila pilipes]
MLLPWRLATSGGHVQTFLMKQQFSSQCLLLVFYEVECLTPNEKESCMDESKPSIDADDYSEKTMMIYENSDLFDELLSTSINYYKTINVLSYIFTFIHNCRGKNKKDGSLKVEEFVLAE